MLTAISTDGRYVSPHFGRCPSFTLVDIEKGIMLNKTVVDNPGHSPGAIPEFLHAKGVKRIVCGGMGARAQTMFDEVDIEVVIGVEGELDDVIKRLENGMLRSGTSLCRPGGGRGYGIDKTVCDHPHDD